MKNIDFNKLYEIIDYFHKYKNVLLTLYVKVNKIKLFKNTQTNNKENTFNMNEYNNQIRINIVLDINSIDHCIGISANHIKDRNLLNQLLERKNLSYNKKIKKIFQKVDRLTKKTIKDKINSFISIWNNIFNKKTAFIFYNYQKFKNYNADFCLAIDDDTLAINVNTINKNDDHLFLNAHLLSIRKQKKFNGNKIEIIEQKINLKSRN